MGLDDIVNNLKDFVVKNNWATFWLFLIYGLLDVVIMTIFLSTYGSNQIKTTLEETSTQTIPTISWSIFGIGIFFMLIFILLRIYYPTSVIDLDEHNKFLTVMTKGGWFALSLIHIVMISLLIQYLKNQLCDDFDSWNCTSSNGSKTTTGQCVRVSDCTNGSNLPNIPSQCNNSDANGNYSPDIICCPTIQNKMLLTGSKHQTLKNCLYVLLGWSITVFVGSIISLLLFTHKSKEEKVDYLIEEIQKPEKDQTSKKKIQKYKELDYLNDDTNLIQ